MPFSQIRKGSSDADITLLEIFTDNQALTRNITKAQLMSYASAIHTNGSRKVSHLKLFMAIIKPDGETQPQAQTLVMDVLMAMSDDYMQLYSEGSAFRRLVKLMEAAQEEDLDTDNLSSTSELAFHLGLVDLLAACTEGFNAATAIRGQSMLPLEDVAKVSCWVGLSGLLALSFGCQYCMPCVVPHPYAIGGASPGDAASSQAGLHHLLHQCLL